MDDDDRTLKTLAWALRTDDAATAERLAAEIPWPALTINATYALFMAAEVGDAPRWWPWLEAQGLAIDDEMRHGAFVSAVKRHQHTRMDWIHAHWHVPFGFEGWCDAPDHLFMDLIRNTWDLKDMPALGPTVGWLVEHHIPIHLAPAQPHDALRLAFYHLKHAAFPVVDALLSHGADAVTLVSGGDHGQHGNALHVWCDHLEVDSAGYPFLTTAHENLEGQFTEAIVVQMWARLVEAGADPHALRPDPEAPEHSFSPRQLIAKTPWEPAIRHWEQAQVRQALLQARPSSASRIRRRS